MEGDRGHVALRARLPHERAFSFFFFFLTNVYLRGAVCSFSEGVEQRDGGFVTWLWEYASSALDGSDLEAELQKARAQLVTWPLVQETDWEYVDTPEKVRQPVPSKVVR